MRDKIVMSAVIGAGVICLSMANAAYPAGNPEISRAQRIIVFAPEVQMVEPKGEEGTPQGQGTVSPPVHNAVPQETAAQQITAGNPPAQETETAAGNPPVQELSAVGSTGTENPPVQEKPTDAVTGTIPEQKKMPAASAQVSQETSSVDSSSQDMPVIDANPLGKRENFLSALPGTEEPGTGNPPGFASIPVTAGSGKTLADVEMQNGVLAGSGRVMGYGPEGAVEESSVSAQRTEIVEYARQFLGNPYVYGGTSLTQGADCSGFVLRIFEHAGVTVPRNSREQAAQGRQIAIEAVQPGDLLFYASGNYINHVAIYIGGGQIIHAANASMGITISPFDYRTPCMAASYLD